ncbi:Mu transposase C-terminal domain-containing protein [Pseudomonas sp. GX19020]|uniref:transposase domain-containing protein n=1 Tax=Pseudomonas sp. GX19020 TaxID=2942277 RepID=UPI0020184A6D|nr:transposase domain-containing protein [Pseudomonas sp. GX19020]MCL4065897.1 Mu transposase C-terminal domain-containing protein [Pseudomonas sp. GX19020]
MTLQLPVKEWWSAREIAEAGLPDLPNTQQGVEAEVKRDGWRGHPAHARKREGRGGGWEYSWRLFPSSAQRKLIMQANAPEEPKSRPDRDEAWSWFDSRPEHVKEKAKACLRILQEVEALAPAVGKYLAVGMIGTQRKISDRTIFGWFERVEGVRHDDRLPYLADRRGSTAAKTTKAAATGVFCDTLKALYMRVEGPDFRPAWRDAVKICREIGEEWLEYRTALRWYQANVRRTDDIFARQGVAGLRSMFPPQIRDRSTMTAMEMVTADCHKVDVFVWWPGIQKPVRVQLIAFQDVYSGKILSWSIDLNPNKVATMQTFMKVLRDYGIPGHCLFDNGMEFANKDMTGGAKHRFRFKLSEEEPVGILGMLGIGMTFATPGHGQAKPIERSFGDLAEDLAKDIRFAGAYVGNRPDAKPENYMSRAIDLGYFIEVTEERINEHNAREGRRSHTARGRSFDETFADSYQRTPIRKATEEQTRLCLMAMYVRPLNKKNGQITLYKNFYWSEWMNERAGQTVTARFNPEDLHEGAYIYAMDGQYLGFAECRQKTGFRDIASAKALARENSRRLKEARKRLAELLPVKGTQVAAQLDALPKQEASLPEAVVVQLDRLSQLESQKKRGGLIQPALPAPDTSRDDELTVLQVDFAAARQDPKRENPDVTRFWRLLDIETRMKACEDIPAADVEFWGRLHMHPTWLAQREIYDRYGAQAIG